MARRPAIRIDDDIETLIQRLQSILINAAEGQRSVVDDRQYPELRQKLSKLGNMPGLVSTHPSVDSFVAFIKGIDGRRARVERVRQEFGPLFQNPDELDSNDVSSEDWTGVSRPAEKVKAVRTLLPLAQAAVEGMIASLSEPGPNGGPLLNEHQEAIENLRGLHRALGELLATAESGHLDDSLGEGLAAEAARYAKRAAKALSRDPMPYLASGLLLGLLSACGLSGVDGYLSGVALNIRKNASKGDEL